MSAFDNRQSNGGLPCGSAYPVGQTQPRRVKSASALMPLSMQRSLCIETRPPALLETLPAHKPDVVDYYYRVLDRRKTQPTSSCSIGSVGLNQADGFLLSSSGSQWRPMKFVEVMNERFGPR
eukprot:gb/GFBE01045244.1/.p1 GENE.gb/GFBE01045244.1/~~gb/GFBE01045244.1/.p1  ORF type:complete len:122 (+),score=7.37 gb/GFBE01045244.1/:1-366(+)